ncbi:hypothetical protein OG242_18525 [Streptomyces sp. NBC_00727]|uniref:hypothetical protein n=1 Tax=Streptomyces sp. NBC_00727 TaxID=2903675 RepID=UPI00386B7E0F
MTENTAWHVRERTEASDGPSNVWTGQAIVTGAVALFVGTALAVEVHGFAELAMDAPAPPDGPGWALVLLPFLTCFGAPFALLASLLVALPTVSTARWVSARTTGPDTWWWVPVVAVVAVSAGVSVVAVIRQPGSGPLTVAWLVSAPLLTGSALLARDAALHGRRILRVFGYGALAAVAVAGIAGAAYGTGVVTEYRPPTMDAAGLAGTYTDGRGGTLWLAADGTARAEDLKFHCTGVGTWSYEPDGPTAWDQLVLLRVTDCSLDWRINGTPEHPKLNREYGTADDPHWYTLAR